MCRGKSFSCLAELLIVVLLLQQTCAETNKQTCAPSSCGKITNISYPFRLKDDPATCGHPRGELACENNITVLSLFSGKYYVQAIDYRNYTIRVVDPGIQESKNCSSIPRYFLSENNFTSEESDMDPYQIGYEDFSFRQVIFLNCSKPVKDDGRYVDTAPCVNWHSTGHLYAIAGYLSTWDLKVGCHVKLVAISTALAFNYGFSGDYDEQNQNLSYTEFHKMLTYGFDLSWIRMSRACEDSCPATRACFFNDTSGDVACDDYCNSSLGFVVECDHLSKQRIFVEDIIYGIVRGLLQTLGLGRYSDSTVSDSEHGIEIGRVTGRYVLPSYIMVRYALGLMVFFVLLIYTCRRRHISMYGSIEVFLQGNNLMPIRYSYKDIKKMTRNFRDKLGEGGYGCVYKGKLRSGPFVAIKMLGKPKANGQEFISEVATIGRIHHANVVRLIGYCVEGSKRALVYEFMPNGSLDRYISSKEDTISLTHKQMYEISLGVARGIAYMHQGCEMQILHFDIKPHNILLDENFMPKVSDFGLAKLYPIANSIVTLTAARGTIGYMAPELFYKNIGGVSCKADVYSFGMLLMEMASKKRNLNPHADRSSQLFFPFWIYNQLAEEKEIEMDEITDEEKNNVKKMFIVALWCIQLKPSDRPSMNKVIEMLEGDIENIEMPPKPSLYPNEMIQEDLEDVDSDEIASDAAAGSVSFLEETATEPLLMYSA